MAMGRSIGYRIDAVQLTNTAVQQLTRGNLAETEALLASIDPKAAKGPMVRRAIATIRALIALYEGKLEDSVRYASSAIEARLGLTTRDFETRQVATAHAIRALAHAALRDAPSAKADADAAEGSAFATPEVIARSRLVRALLASRAAYHEEAFRLYLDANARLVLENTMPRERALFRALRRMSRNPQRSVYRESGHVRDDRAPSKLASWIAFVAPEAAAYVEGDRTIADRIDEAPIDSGVPSDVRALRKARASATSVATPARRLARSVVVGSALVATFVAIGLFFTRGGGPSSLADPASLAPLAPLAPIATTWVDHLFGNALVVVVAAIAVVVITSIARRKQRTLALARRLVALGDRARARPTLVGLAERGSGIEAATAGLELARIAASEARFAEAISRCDAAIARVSAQPLRAFASDVLLPALMTESAVAMATRGGLEDADAELAVLCRDFPTFPSLASAQLRVKLVRSVRGGDRDEACVAARARTAEMPLPYREDVLADLVLASRGEVPEEDLARLEAELRDDAELQTWIDAVAPGIRDDRSTNTNTNGARARVAMSAGRHDAVAEREPEITENAPGDATLQEIGTGD